VKGGKDVDTITTFAATYLKQIILTAFSFGFYIALRAFTAITFKKYMEDRIGSPKKHLLHKISKTFLLLLFVFLLISIWGINIKNLWVFITGAIGVVAIGFFAVWSMLSNIVAGFLLIVSDTFSIGDEIEIIPDGISGKVVEIKSMFVVLKQPGGDIIHVPNNLLFQRIIKKFAKNI
jgi:small-conductance mechanosensitive channel